MNSDSLTGLAAICGGVAYWFAAVALPALPGLGSAPGFFPKIIAGFVIGTGLLLVLRGSVRGEPPEIGESQLDAAFAEAGQSAEQRSVPWTERALRLGAVFGAVVFYILAVEALGFGPTATICAFAVALAFGASPRLAIGSAVVSAVVFSLVFGTILRVPLPASGLSGVFNRFTSVF